MEHRMNIAELLKSCPKGMELDCTLYDNIKLLCVDDKEGIVFPIRVLRQDGNSITLTKYGQITYADFAKCVIYPKGKTTWEGFVPPCQFKDGDVIYNQCIKAAAIFYKQTDDNTISHCFLNVHKELKIQHKHCKLLYGWRFAAEEEKQKLFDAIKAHGYRWNAKTKTLEKVIIPKFKVGDRIKNKNSGIYDKVIKIFEDCYLVESRLGEQATIPYDIQDNWELVPNKFDITTLTPFDKVLIRQNVSGKWGIDFFGFYKEGYYHSTGNCAYLQCIPFEGNEHLLGKTDDCDDFYKTWE